MRTRGAVHDNPDADENGSDARLQDMGWRGRLFAKAKNTIPDGDAPYAFQPHERPLIPGGPYTPAHPGWRRAIYVAVALLTAITATLGNALITVNVASLSGSIGEYVTAVSLLPAIYVAMNACGNLLLVKGRMQFGIPAITHGLLAAYVIAGLAQFLIPGMAAAIGLRAISGITASALTTITIYYLLQVFPPKARPAALVVGLGFIQLGTPLARLFPVELLAAHDWRNLHLIELALPLAALSVLLLVPLPPNDRSKAFVPCDLLTAALIFPAMLLLCAALSEGRLLWWTNAPWIGWSLALSVPLFAAAVLVETHRANPLLRLEWIGSGGILRFAAVALLMRLALAEQTYGSVGLLTSGGLTNDQLRLLFAIVLGAMLLGIGVAVATLRPDRIRYQVMVAALIIGIGAWMDAQATNATRPQELFLSQALIGFGTTLFIGPGLAFGFMRMMERGPAFFVSLVVLFSSTQNIGGLAGSAFLGSYQVVATRAHVGALSEHLLASDPQVSARLQAGAQALASAIVDPAQRAAQGGALLAQAMTREATILAFNDVFRFVAFLAFGTALYLAYLEILSVGRQWRSARQEALP